MSVNIQEQFQKMGLGEKIILVAGPLFFINGFLPWFDYDVPGGASRSGWSGDLSLFSILAILVALIMAAQVAIVRFTSVQLPELPSGFTWARIHLGGAAFIAAAVVLRLIIGESAGPFDADRTFGLFIAIIIAAALAAGGFLLYQEEQQGGGAGTGADAGPPSM